MLLNVIFSYNRAMQLDYLLQSIFNKFKITDYKIAIIYHTTDKHKKGYELIKQKYASDKSIEFYERKEGYDWGISSAISCRTNLKFFKQYHFKNPKRDNFKGLLEKILFKTSCEFVMFNTDDSVFIDDFSFDKEIINLIRYNPNISYRTYVGDNIDDFPNYVKKWNNYYLWDYYYEKKITHWSYPFAVDGTIYNTKKILPILKRVAYHNPITLEGNAVEFIRRNKLLGIGISPVKSLLIGTKLNRVSTDSLNPTIHISPDMLNDKFIDGYTLELKFPKEIKNSNIVPIEVSITKNTVKENLYAIDEHGLYIQNNLGAEGAKQQIE